MKIKITKAYFYRWWFSNIPEIGVYKAQLWKWIITIKYK